MKRIFSALLCLLSPILLLTGCGGAPASGSYQQINQEKAKEMMGTETV